MVTASCFLFPSGGKERKRKKKKQPDQSQSWKTRRAGIFTSRFVGGREGGYGVGHSPISSPSPPLSHGRLVSAAPSSPLVFPPGILTPLHGLAPLWNQQWRNKLTPTLHTLNNPPLPPSLMKTIAHELTWQLKHHCKCALLALL